MGGGLIQITAYGKQDARLTTNMQITFFKMVYHSHTNFAMESIEQTFSGTPKLGSRITATISRNGDLITGLWLSMKMKVSSNAGIKYAAYCLGYACIKTVELEIGGKIVDKQTGEWMNIYTELTTPTSKRDKLDHMIGIINSTYGPASGDGVDEIYTLNVPLQFSFCRNPGLAIPIICISLHEIKIIIEFETAENIMGNADGISLLDCALWVDFICLDTEERRRFAKNPHEYLFEQLQYREYKYTHDDNKYTKINMDFVNPVKELIWTCKEDNILGNPCGSYNDKIESAVIRFNDRDRFSIQDKSYFIDVQQYKYHKHPARIKNSQYYYVYSFSLNPDEIQPSGTCNFSNLETIALLPHIKCQTSLTIKVYAVSYNILQVMYGMADVVWEN